MSAAIDTVTVAAAGQPGEDPRGSANRSASPFSFKQIDPCCNSRCRCFGQGCVAMLGACSSLELQQKVDKLVAQHLCLLELNTHRPHAASTRVYYRDSYLCSLPAATPGHATSSTAILDLTHLQPASIRVEAAEEGQHLLLLYQPPASNELETFLRTTLPRDLRRLPPGIISQPGLLLLVQEGGWAVGDFLAKASLLRQRERWRAGTAAEITSTAQP